jgi:hypothetical protein
MMSPQGMDELFWGQNHEDVNDWAEDLPWPLKCATLLLTSCSKSPS